MFFRDGSGFDQYLLGAPRHFIRDNGIIMGISGSEPCWFPGPDPLEITQATALAPPVAQSKTKEKKIPRPPNAYILYRKERHHLIEEANPGITNNEICAFLYLHIETH